MGSGYICHVFFTSFASSSEQKPPVNIQELNQPKKKKMAQDWRRLRSNAMFEAWNQTPGRSVESEGSARQK